MFVYYMYYTILYVLILTMYVHYAIRIFQQLQDSRLFGPRPWKILATTNDKKRLLSNPDPGENPVSGNLVMETGCIL